MTDADAPIPEDRPEGQMEDQAESKPEEQLAERLELHPSRTRWGTILAVCIFLVLCDFYLISQQDIAILWVGVVIFTLVGAMAAVQFYGAGGMLLERTQFRYRLLFAEKSFRWDDVTPFYAGNAGLMKLVGFRTSEDIEKKKPARMVPDTYGLHPDELAELLNSWRNRALTEK
jgi:hypothetical protein